MATYFTADTHFGHENVISLCNRPFADLREMTAVLVSNWNARVTSKDDIYILGDLWFRGGTDNAVDLLHKLNGRKHLIAGNYDVKSLKNPAFREQFVEIEDLITISLDGTRIVLCHYPIAEWYGYYRGSYHIYGHIHNNRHGVFEYLKTQERALNAGVDITDFMPVTFEELIRYNELFKSMDDESRY